MLCSGGHFKFKIDNVFKIFFFQPAAIGSAIMELESPDDVQEHSSLLSEFSLQIIHQPIYITARRFLVFNLSFISSVSIF